MSNDVTRRDAFKALAAGGAGALIAGHSAADAQAAPASPASSIAHEATQLAARDITVPSAAITALATVMHCRSWSQQVYLHINDQLRGFVALTTEGFALAAACQAAGRPIAVCCWGCQPLWNDVGRFDGAIVAIDLRDLPGESISSLA